MAGSSLSPDSTEHFSKPAETIRFGLSHSRGSKTLPFKGVASTPGPRTLPDPPNGYELLEEIGRGSMGVVYRARDLRLHRELAIKILSDSRDGDHEAATRFRAEAQITGQLEHPGIPAVHELGALPDGRPFLAMRLNKGQTLYTLLSDRPELHHDSGRFVAIFEQICHAVGFAHAHGVIHRDLKPQNIMVGEFGEVQVMDWGLAKRLAPERNGRHQAPVIIDRSLGPSVSEREPSEAKFDDSSTSGSATQVGSVLGTPAFLSPEQANGDLENVDRQSDVFGLGAVLCVILTGKAPYHGRGVRTIWQQAAKGELESTIVRIDASDANAELIQLCKRCLSIKKEDRPTDGAEVALEVARIRQAAEDRLRHAELEREKSMVRDAEERKRRSQLVKASALIAATLCVGIVGTTLGLIQARSAADAERSAKLDANQQKEIAVQEAKEKSAARLNEEKLRKTAEQAALAERGAKEQAQKRLEQIKNSNEILASIFRELDIRNVRENNEPLEAALSKKLIEASNKLSADSVGDPLQVAELQCYLGVALTNLGFATKSVSLLEQARNTYRERLPSHDEKVLLSTSQLAFALMGSGKSAKAVPLLEEVWRLRKESLPEDDQITLGAMNDLAEGYRANGQFAKAMPLWEKTVRLSSEKLGKTSPYTLTAMNNLAAAYQMFGRFRESLPLHEQVLRSSREVKGNDHLETITAINNLAGAYFSLGQLDKGVTLQEEAVQRTRAKLGAEHPQTLTRMVTLAYAYRRSERALLAVPILQEVLQTWQTKHGASHIQTLQTMDYLALAYQDAKQFDKALPLFEKAVALKKANLGEAHQSTLITLNNFAECYRSAGKVDKTVLLLEQVVKGTRTSGDIPFSLSAMSNLAAAYDAVGRSGEAIELYEAAAKKVIAKGKLTQTLPLSCLNNIVDWYEQRNNLERAEYWRREWNAMAKSRYGESSPFYVNLLARFGENLQKQGKLAPAAQALRECVQLREKHSLSDWRKHSAQAVLGSILLDQKQYEEAERYLTAGYEGLRKRLNEIPKEFRHEQLSRTLKWRIRLYDALSKPSDSSRCQDELKALKSN